MVNLPLNTFRNISEAVTTTEATMYTTPLGITSIMLMAQVANITNVPVTVTFVHYSYRRARSTFVVKDMIVPPSDARILLGGKLVLETGDQVLVQGSANNSLEFLASVLETANQ
jgi:hypothetical protein